MTSFEALLGKQLDTVYMDRWLAEFSKVPGLERVLDAWREARK